MKSKEGRLYWSLWLKKKKKAAHLIYDLNKYFPLEFMFQLDSFRAYWIQNVFDLQTVSEWVFKKWE